MPVFTGMTNPTHFECDERLFQHPAREEDDPGVNVGDAIKIARHLAELEPFDMPYKLIAADVYQQPPGYVNVGDIIKICRYLAELEDLPTGNWIFVDSSFGISFENWWLAPQDIGLTLTDHDMVDQSFVGIRAGDVNNTWTSAPAVAKSISL